MSQKKSINLGFRGWMLVLYQAIAFFAQTIFKNWPLNILADMYGGAQIISTLCTVAMMIGIVAQLLLSRWIGRIRSVKMFGIVLGVLSMLFALCVMLIPPSSLGLWRVAYFLTCLIITIWATFPLGILVGQWFPRRKGTVMGIATFAFPITNALMSIFAKLVFKSGAPDVFGAFLPFYIVCVIGIIIGAIFVKDYPEQCGCYRDNDKSLTPEVAQAMLAKEIENKKTTVWTVGHTLASGEFWFLTIPMGFLLLSSVGMMTQTAPILGSYGIASGTSQFSMAMLGICVAACFGSWLLGVLDTKFGTKLAIVIAVIVMIVGGVAGAIRGSLPCLVIALFCLAVFMGASSNFTVSAAAQYWRREDFSSVYSCVNPIANILQALGPMVIAMLVGTQGANTAFAVVGVFGVISLILILLFRPERVKALDDRYRQAAGKPLDDVLVGRK